MRMFLLALSLWALASCAAKVSDRRGLFQTSELPTQAWEENSGECRALSREDRLRLLRIAAPNNFPRTRYRKGPRRSPEKETDCSHFVHEIYRRAGFPFEFRTTRKLGEAPEFERLPERAAQPGDLMMFRGHVGIVDLDGRIISATESRRNGTAITRLDRRFFRPSRASLPVLRYRCRPRGNRQIAQYPSR